MDSDGSLLQAKMSECHGAQHHQLNQGIVSLCTYAPSFLACYPPPLCLAPCLFRVLCPDSR